MHGTGYYHILDERIRIQVAEVKGSPSMVEALESQLAKWNSVTHVPPLTGLCLGPIRLSGGSSKIRQPDCLAMSGFCKVATAYEQSSR
jgi:hypothetical protein